MHRCHQATHCNQFSSSAFFCISGELHPILPLHQWRGSHPGTEVKSGIAKDGHACNSLVLEPYSPFMPSEQQEETLVWPSRRGECTERARRKAWMSTRSRQEQAELWGEVREPAALLSERISQQRDVRAWAIHQTAGKLIYAKCLCQGWGLGLPKISPIFGSPPQGFLLPIAVPGLLTASVPAKCCFGLLCCK